MRWTTTAALALGMLAVAGNAWAQDSTIDFIVAGPADWNTATNWNAPGFGNAVPGDGFPQEIASISNAGVAELTSAAEFDISGLVIGETHNPARAGGPNATEEDGTLNISGAGQLRLVDTGGMGGAALRVGDAGRGVLNMSGGSASADSLAVGGAADSAINLSGDAVLTVSGDANLLRTARISGPDVFVEVEGNLQVRGTLIPKITGLAHSAIQVATGNANLGGTLRPEFNGHTPMLGDSWTLIEAGSVTGVFDNIELSQAPQFPRGALFDVSYDEGGSGAVVLSVDRRLILNVNRGTGAVSIENAIGDPVEFDGYVIGSPSGLLDPSDGAWQSLEDAGESGWEQANPTNQFLNELNPSGSLSIAAGISHSLGTPYSFQPTAIGQSGDELTFEYSTADGRVVPGLIEYTGPRNNLLLTVDPTTGEAVLSNDSMLMADIEGYSIGSPSGSLLPADGDWSSLEDQSVGDWEEANPNSFFLSELNPTGSSLLSPGQALDLGSPFALGGEQDLTLEFLLATGETLFGDVEYGEIAPTGQPGDTNGDGLVDIDDLNNVRNNFGDTGLPDGSLPGDAFPFDGMVDIDDLNGVRNNFGAGPAPVPEPGSWLLACLGLAFIGRRRSRK